MSNLKRNVNLFFFRNRNKGIPRLMLWICVGNAIVYLFSLVNHNLPSFLYFESQKILQGQIWRLFSYVFTFACEANFFGIPLIGAVISIFFYYWIGNVLENSCGTLRFNLFYLSGILITDIVALLLYAVYPIDGLSINSHFLNLSMFLAVATLLPESRVYVYMVIPIKMKWMAWAYLGIIAYQFGRNIYTLISIFSAGVLYASGRLIAFYILYALFPLLPLPNYFLFFGSKFKNLFPQWRKISIRKQSRRDAQKKAAQTQPNPDWAKNYRSPSGERPYRHKCTVCGRTDTDCPDLEFRYCSRCKGYFCYCIDHINNHTHVE